MGNLVVSGAVLTCSFGAAPSTLTVLPVNMLNASSMPAATIMDNVAMVNIMSFGMCSSPANPAVAAATAAAAGVLTPQPCVPVIPAPWVPGSPTLMIGGQPALNDTSKCMCAYGGVISITMPGQMTVQVP